MELAALGSVNEHFDEVVVHAVVEVALEGPGELGMLQVAGVDGGIVGVKSEGRVLEADDEFDGAVLFASREVEECVLIARGFGEHLFERRHGPMLA